MALKDPKKKSVSEEKITRIKKFVEDTRSQDAIWLGENRKNEELPDEIAKADHRIAFCDQILEMLK